jgi:hypothetical protein
MQAGEQLPPGASITSPDNHYRLVMQGDGNLVEYVGSRALWHTHTNGHAGALARMQSDGNLVVYDANLTALWSSGTGGRTGTFHLDLQNDANLVIRNGSAAIWATYTKNPKLASGEGLNPGQFIYSTDGSYRVVMQGDGNLVEYQGGTALWSTQTNDYPGAYARMQTDGNLVVYSSGVARWNSKTAGNSGAWLSLQADSNLVVRSASGEALWARFGLDPEPSLPPAVQGAIDWAKARLGQAIYQGLCLQFVHDAYLYGGGKNIGGAPTAVDYWNASGATRHTDTNPPAGALVFWGATVNNSAGHVGLSLGSGQVISSEERSYTSIHTFAISTRNAAGYPYLGWLMP